MRRLALVFVFVVMPAAVARAQDSPGVIMTPAQTPPRVTGTVGGAIVGPLSGTADNFSTGWGVDLGVTWHLTDQMGVRFDYLYSGLDGKDTPPGAVPVDSWMRMHGGTAAFVFQAPPGAVRLYVLAGGGIYHRSVSLSTSATGTVSVCNPWWFVCTSQPEPATSLAGSHASTEVGVNVGAGFNTRYVFVEARYHYMTGPSFSTPTGSQKATGKFFPLIVGVRFPQAR